MGSENERVAYQHGVDNRGLGKALGKGGEAVVVRGRSGGGGQVQSREQRVGDR